MKKNIVLFFLVSVSWTALHGQPWPRQERYTLDNTKQMTDASVSLFSVHSDYDFPYVIPTREDVTEKLTRILRFLEKSTADGFVDAETGERITDLTRLPEQFLFDDTGFRIYNYEWGVTYSGMLRAYEATGVKRFRDYTVDRIRLLSEVLPQVKKRITADPRYASPVSHAANPHNLDQCGSLLAAIIRTVIEDPGIDMEAHIGQIADFITHVQYRLADGTLARKGPYESTLWLDDLYMSVPALTMLYRHTGEQSYLDDAVRQVLQFSSRMFVPEMGLYMHSWVDVMSHHPRMYWGRANGWATLAMCDLLDALPENHPDYVRVRDQFTAHCWGLMQCQSGKGMWHQLLDRNDSYLESSGTAMFVYGLARGINRGWLDPKVFGPAALAGWNGLGEQINNTGQIENVCVGTGVSFEPSYYYYRHVHPYTSHGYGPVLLAGSEIIALVENFDIRQNTSIYFYDRK